MSGGFVINDAATGAGSVAAADITDAGTTGVALVQAESAAEAQAAVYPRTAVTTASGWTTGGTGGTVTQGASTLAVAITSGQSGASISDAYVPRAHKAHGLGTTRITLRARLASLTPAGTATQVYAWFGLGTGGGTAQGPWVGVGIRGDGLVELAAVNAAGSLATTIVQSASGALPLDGTGWVEIDDDGGSVEVRYGTGTTSDPPSAWTPLGSYAPTRAELEVTPRPHVVARMTQWSDQGAQASSWASITTQARR